MDMDIADMDTENTNIITKRINSAGGEQRENQTRICCKKDF